MTWCPIVSQFEVSVYYYSRPVIHTCNYIIIHLADLTFIFHLKCSVTYCTCRCAVHTVLYQYTVSAKQVKC